MQITININIDGRIIKFIKKPLATKTSRLRFFTALLICATIVVNAASITKPYTFEAGQDAMAEEVNANFDALFTKVNELDSAVTSLQTSSITSETDPSVNALAKASLNCSANEVARYDGTNWICASDEGLTSESDPSVNSLAKATLSCGIDQIVKYNGTSWVCASDEGLTSESDPSVNSLAKATLSCSTDQIVKYNGSAWVCASDSTNTSCPSDMVDIGSFCIDKYEASPDTSRIIAIAVDNDSLDRGTGSANVNIYAPKSVTGADPYVNITWFDAARACASVSKRLPTNEEWQIAALGTDDSAGGGTSDPCNVNSGSIPSGATGAEYPSTTGAHKTGTAASCISNPFLDRSDDGVYDMVGNAWEWVSMWNSALRMAAQLIGQVL